MKTAIMCTGGIDSTTLLYMYAERNPTPITVDYGHSAFQKEKQFIQWHIDNLNLPELVVIPVTYLDWQAKGGLFTSDYAPEEENPLNEWDKLRYESFFVEGRNVIMVSYILAYCSAFQIDELLAGYLYSQEEWENRRTYKLMTGDNSPQFVDTMNLVSNLGFSYQVRFRAPFYEQRQSKRDVVEIGKRLGIDYSKTHSCYFDEPCGVCDNCLLREKLKID